MFSQGAAGLEGTICRGDIVLSINGSSLSGRTHGEALSYLHQTKLAQKALVVIQRGKDSEPVTVRQELVLKPRTGSSSAFPDISRENGAGKYTLITNKLFTIEKNNADHYASS